MEFISLDGEEDFSFLKKIFSIYYLNSFTWEVVIDISDALISLVNLNFSYYLSDLIYLYHFSCSLLKMDFIINDSASSSYFSYHLLLNSSNYLSLWKVWTLSLEPFMSMRLDCYEDLKESL